MKKKILALASAVLITCSLMFGGLTAPANAENTATASCNDGGFLGFLPWYHGVIDLNTCQIKTPSGTSSDDGANKIAGFVWKIVANILVDLFMAVGYISVGFVMYGGYLYITSEGDPGKASKGQKTLSSAIIGILIAVLANLIIRTLMIILGV